MKKATRKNIIWLLSELDGWIKDGLIHHDQGERIRRRYPIPEDPVSWAKIIFTSIGAILFGLGVILLFAYNWEKMHRFAKLAVVFLSLLLCHGFGLWLSRTGSRHQASGHGFHIMGTMLFGAGIWLIAQIYHIDEHYPNAFLVWGSGALGLAWAIPSVPQGIMASLLFVFWGGVEVFDFRQPNPMAFMIILIGILPLAFHLRSRVLVGVVIPSFLTALTFSAGRLYGELVFPVLFYSACALIGTGILVRQSNYFEKIAPIFTFFGYLIYLTILYLLSFKDFTDIIFRLELDQSLHLLYLQTPILAAVIIWGIVFYTMRQIKTHEYPFLRPDHIAVPFAGILFWITLNTNLAGWQIAVLYNILFLFHMIIMIHRGCVMLDMKLTATGCILLSLLAMTRYVDLFESLIARAIVFFIIGGFIFAVGNFYSKIKHDTRQAES